MNRTTLALTLSTVLLVAGCGGDAEEPSDSNSATTTQSDTPASTSPTPEEPAAPEYQVLDKADLEGALLTIQDMPPGYSQDPPTEPSDKTFCDYKEPVQEDVLVRHDFSKGGGMSAELDSVSIRQFKSPEDASKAFDALADVVNTCPGDTIDGTEAKYTPMSAPKVGDGSVGIRIEADQFTILQNFILVGPSIISAGGAGLTNINSDQVTQLVEAQVKKYENAATS